MKELQEFMDVQDEWATKTFGVGDGTGTLHHLKEEVGELIEAVGNSNEGRRRGVSIQKLAGLAVEERLEFADCFILLLNAASKRGMTAESLMDAARHKQQINFKRKWGEPDENGVVNHIK